MFQETSVTLKECVRETVNQDISDTSVAMLSCKDLVKTKDSDKSVALLSNPRLVREKKPY